MTVMVPASRSYWYFASSLLPSERKGVILIVKEVTLFFKEIYFSGRKGSENSFLITLLRPPWPTKVHPTCS